MSKKSPKDRLKVVIDLASVLLYQLKELIYSSSPESEKVKADKVCRQLASSSEKTNVFSMIPCGTKV